MTFANIGETPSISVKNTFIDFPGAEVMADRRTRSASLPPNRRKSTKQESEVCSGLSPKEVADEAYYSCTEDSCTESTDADNCKDDDLSTSGSDSFGSRKASEEAETQASDDPHTPKPMSWFEVTEMGEQESDSSDQACEADSETSVPVAASPRPKSTRKSLRTCLSAKATPWQSTFQPASEAPAVSPVVSVPATGDATLMQHFDASVASAVGTVKAVLVQSGMVIGVDAVNSGFHEGAQRQGWVVVVHVRPQDAHVVDTLLKLAKEQFIGAAAHSECTYVLGYGARPFEDRPQGFVVKLGAMKEASNACWTSFQQGCCAHGAACRLQHPCAISAIGLKVEFLPV